MEEDARRNLAAVMFVDMVGFTALMGRDEASARRQRDVQRDVVGRCVERHGGKVRQHYGDGTLCTFPSAVEAVRCAVEIQRTVRQPPEIPLRVGIHSGDIVEEEDGVAGDGVNVAARVEALAPPGAVVVSDKVYDEIKNHRDLEAVSLGSAVLKNVTRPVELFALVAEGLPMPDRGWLGRASKPTGPRPWRTALVAAVLMGVIALGAVRWAMGRRADAGLSVVDDRPFPSLAVLPFRNLSAEGENAAFFADGLHDDLLTLLSKVGSMRVIARTSVMRYQDDPSSSIPEIARELGVGMVLEGGVQRAGDRIRLNVQLIDGATDAHIWAETYEEELTAENVFGIQAQVAEAISRELRAVVTGAERRALRGVPTRSIEAYEHFLMGSSALLGSSAFDDLTVAETEFREAVRLDPGFAVALARLAFTHLDIYWNAFDRSDERLTMAAEALRAAEAIDPDDPEVLYARAHYHYWGYRDYAAAQDALAQAQAKQPGDGRFHEARAYVVRRMGELALARRELETATALDPLNSEIALGLARTLRMMGMYPQARRAFERTLAIEPSMWAAKYEWALTDVMESGDLSRLKVAVGEPSDEFPDVQLHTRWWIAYVEGDVTAALNLAAQATEPLGLQAAIYPASLLEALTYRSVGRAREAAAAAEAARAELEPARAQDVDDPRVHAAIGTAYALLGRREEAVAAGNEAVRLLPVERDAVDGPEYLLHQARIHALLGETEPAAAILRRLDGMPLIRMSRNQVLLEPAFEALRDRPDVEP